MTHLIKKWLQRMQQAAGGMREQAATNRKPHTCLS